jgi:hypothetical protein
MALFLNGSQDLKLASKSHNVTLEVVEVAQRVPASSGSYNKEPSTYSAGWKQLV